MATRVGCHIFLHKLVLYVVYFPDFTKIGLYVVRFSAYLSRKFHLQLSSLKLNLPSVRVQSPVQTRANC